MRRVVITGLGTVSPLGVGVNHVWNELIAGKSGIRKVEHIDVSDLPSQVGGYVPHGDGTTGHTFNPDLLIAPKDQRKMDKFIVYGMAAAHEALEDSGWLNTASEEDFERAGVMVGSGIGGLQTIAETAITLEQQGPRRVSPFFIPSSIINLASGQISIRYGLKGPNHSVVTACSTSAHAIGDAMRIIQHGDADMMVAGGTEASVCRLAMAGFCAARALSSNFNDSPEKASRPWDQDRDGFVISEGAAVLILEEYESAKKRGAKIYAEVVGYGMSGDAYHITSPSGDGAYRAMKSALRDAKLNPSDIGYINAHGTSTPAGDVSELEAVKRAFDNDIKLITMSSTKSAVGHLLGAAGGIEAIFSIKAMNAGILPPTLNLDNPDEAVLGVNLIAHTAQEKKVDAIMSNSFGFGGTNASLVFKRV